MKKYILFTMIFITSYIVLQISTGFILTMLFTPSLQLQDKSGITSQVVFGDTNRNLIHGIFIILVSLGISFGITKRLCKKTSS